MTTGFAFIPNHDFGRTYGELIGVRRQQNFMTRLFPPGYAAVMITIGLLSLAALGCGNGSPPQSASEPSNLESQAAESATPPLDSQNADSTTARGDTTVSASPQTASPPHESPAPQSAARLVAQSIESLEAGESQSALASAFKARDLAPNDPNVLFTVARALAARRRFHEAVRTLDRLADSHPETWIPAVGQTAEWLVEMGETDEAEKRYRQLRNEVDEASKSFVDRQLAVMFLRQGSRPAAANIFRDLCSAGDTNLPELMTLLRIALPLSDQMNLPEGIEPVTALGRAQASAGRGEWDKATRTLERAKATDEVVAMRGRIYAQQEQQELLEEWALTEYADTNTDVAANYGFGVHQLHAGNADKAAAAFARVILADQTDPEAYQYLGKALMSLNRQEDADRILARAELIGQTQTIGERLASGSVTANEMLELADLLEQLQRPLEALAWRAMQVRFEQSSGQIQAREASEAYAEIDRQRARLQQAGTAQPDQAFVLCGVKLDLE